MRRALNVALGCGLFCLGMGGAVLLGWVGDIGLLKTGLPGLIPMTPWTAAAFFLAGIVLLCSIQTDEAAPVRLVKGVSLGAIAVVAVIEILETVFGFDTGLDGLLSPEGVGGLQARSAVVPALLFLVFVLAVMADRRFTKGGRAFVVTGTTGLIAAWAVVLACVFSAKIFCRSNGYNAVAVHAALTFVVLFLGLLATRPSQGWIRMLLSDSLGGVAARCLLPIVILVPAAIGIGLLLVSRATQMDADFRLALVTTSVTLVLMSLVLRNARMLERIDQKRRTAEDALARAHETALIARAEAERATESKSRFFAAASHDLRQPVQSLFLFHTALASVLTDHPAAKIVSNASTALNSLKYLLDALLDVSRLDAGIVTAEVIEFPLETVIRPLIEEYRLRAREKGIRLRWVRCSGYVRSDPALLQRVLRNLLENSLRYTKGGSILVGCRHSPDDIRVCVVDTGIGIPADQLSAIFHEFLQLPHQSGQGGEGLGLGLSIVRRICDLLQYPVDVRSNEGRGSCFAIRIPRAPRIFPSRPVLSSGPADTDTEEGEGAEQGALAE